MLNIWIYTTENPQHFYRLTETCLAFSARHCKRQIRNASLHDILKLRNIFDKTKIKQKTLQLKIDHSTTFFMFQKADIDWHQLIIVNFSLDKYYLRVSSNLLDASFQSKAKYWQHCIGASVSMECTYIYIYICHSLRSFHDFVYCSQSFILMFILRKGAKLHYVPNQ